MQVSARHDSVEPTEFCTSVLPGSTEWRRWMRLQDEFGQPADGWPRYPVLWSVLLYTDSFMLSS